MDFLKTVLGDDLFGQVKKAIDAHNGNDENKDNQIKIGNLGGGEYVGKGKYDALQELLDGKETELTSANDLIAQLKKDSKGNEEMQGKITAYEGQVADLQQQLAETKLNSAIKVALLEAKAKDIDYLSFKLTEGMKEKGEKLELDENDNIKDWDDKLKGLQTQFSNMFEAGGGEGGKGGYEPYNPKGLPKGGDDKTVTKDQFRAMTYEERVKLKKENEKLYQQLKN